MYLIGIALFLLSIPSFAQDRTVASLRAEAKLQTNDTLCMVQILRPDLGEIYRDELIGRKTQCDWERTKLQVQTYLENQARQQQAAQLAQQNSQAAQEADSRLRLQMNQLQAQIDADERRRKDDANDRLLQQGLQLMRDSRPRPTAPMPPMQTNCRTVYQGSGVSQTVCN